MVIKTQCQLCCINCCILYNIHNRNSFHSKWICSIENILNECGYSEYWLTQYVHKSVCLSKNVKQRLCDQFKQRWSTTVFNSSKCLNYRIFKCSHGLEKYLLNLSYDLRRALCNFRCLYHRLPIERGRFWVLKEMIAYVIYVTQVL